MQNSDAADRWTPGWRTDAHRNKSADICGTLDGAAAAPGVSVTPVNMAPVVCQEHVT